MSRLKHHALRGYAAALTHITKRYLRRYQPRVIVVAGSIGKTSTTQAITTMLAQKYRVRSTIKSYNVAHALPLSVFAEELPTSKAGWLTLVPRIAQRARTQQPFDTLVLEIGTDHPGELAQFAYLKPELGIVTAITPEHMEYFKTLEAVAREELSLVKFCEMVLVDAGMVAEHFRHDLPANVAYYGTGDYAITAQRRDGYHQVISLRLGSIELSDIATQFIGGQSLHAVLAAATVGAKSGLDASQIEAGIKALAPVAGRMQLLNGINHSRLIDDSYNASPEAVTAALDTMTEIEAPQKIAILGSMNGLGDSSASSHRQVGLHCDPTQLDLVITIGQQAAEHLAPAARVAGCKVLSTDSPYTAGQLARDHLQAGALVLIKGSQNRVFAEEAIKSLLLDAKDRARLVRQSPYWLRIKRSQFGDSPHPDAAVDRP